MISASRKTWRRERNRFASGVRQISIRGDADETNTKKQANQSGRDKQMKKISVALAAILASAAYGGTSLAADVKIGVVMGLSGPPAIVDFGESYLQGMKLA